MIADRRVWKRVLTALGALVVAALVAYLGPGDGQDGSTASDRSGTPATATPSLTGPPPGAGESSRSSGEGTDTAASEPGSEADAGDDSDREVDPESGLPWIDEADLTPEGRETLALIDAGGPFPYPDRDGSTFGNFEGLLPDRPRGYYAEYTVPTPGEDDRGARRIIVGDGGEYYWTVDHYESFERIRR